MSDSTQDTLLRTLVDAYVARAGADVVEAPPAPTPAPTIDTLKIPLELTFPDQPNAYVLVGAGGTGARVASLLPKIVRAQDSVIIFDHDTVEPKNLIRQHFVHEDIGKNKAIVAAARLKKALIPQLRDAVPVHAIGERITSRWAGRVQDAARGRRWVYIGCVDNAEARKSIYNQISLEHGGNAVWIDSGNLLRHGKIILGKLVGRVRVNKAFYATLPAMRQEQLAGYIDSADNYIELPVMYNGIMSHAPELLNTANDAQGPDCDAVVLDGQTAAANQMAASIVFNLLSAMADGLPITAPHYTFSTVPPMVAAEPWKAGLGVTGRYGAVVALT